MKISDEQLKLECFVRAMLIKAVKPGQPGCICKDSNISIVCEGCGFIPDFKYIPDAFAKELNDVFRKYRPKS